MTKLRIVTSIDFRLCKTEAQTAAIIGITLLLYQATRKERTVPLQLSKQDEILLWATGENDHLRQAFERASLLRVRSMSLPLDHVCVVVTFLRNRNEFWEIDCRIDPDGVINFTGSGGDIDFLEER